MVKCAYIKWSNLRFYSHLPRCVCHILSKSQLFSFSFMHISMHFTKYISYLIIIWRKQNYFENMCRLKIIFLTFELNSFYIWRPNLIQIRKKVGSKSVQIRFTRKTNYLVDVISTR